MLTIILIVLITLLLFLNWYFTKNYYYFERKGLPVYKKYNVYEDTYRTLTNSVIQTEMILDQYNAFPDKEVYGVYQFRLPTLQIKDPDLLKLVLVKDFDHFTNHPVIFTPEEEPLFGRNLFGLRGKRWHDMRTTLSPAFTGSKMRAMVPLIKEVCEQVIEHLKQKIAELPAGKTVLTENMGDISTRFTNDTIATIAFGVRIDSLKHQNNEFYQIGQYTQGSGLIWRFILLTLFPGFSKLVNLTLMPKWVIDFFTNMIKETLETRDRENIVRPDMLHLLNEARKGRLEDDEGESKLDGVKGNKIKLSVEDIVSQAFLFFAAGFSSIALTTCWVLYELALNPEIQSKLYNETNEVIREFGNEITYEAIGKMKYLHMVVSETLRKWPIGTTLNREVTKHYRLKTKHGEFELEEGMSIAVPVFGIHRDPTYYPNPDKFDPERFRDPNKIYPCTYIPFGEGPRICIGSRLALLELKIFIVMLLLKFEFVPVEKTPIPPVLKSGINLDLEGGFWLGIKNRV